LNKNGDDSFIVYNIIKLKFFVNWKRNGLQFFQVRPYRRLIRLRLFLAFYWPIFADGYAKPAFCPIIVWRKWLLAVELCMVYLKSSFFLARLDQNISVEGVEGGAADRRLLDEEFQAIIAGGAIVDLSLAALAEFQRN